MYVEHDKLWCNPDQIDRDVRDGQLLKTMMMMYVCTLGVVPMHWRTTTVLHVHFCVHFCGIHLMAMYVCMHVCMYDDI